MNQLELDIHWMQHALELAKIAEQNQEVPVGAVIVQNNQLIGEGYNQSITNHDPTAHAEIIAIRNAANNLHNYRLVNSTMYVTLEPCPMCAAALIHARINRIVFAASDPKTGALGGYMDLYKYNWNHRIICEGGILEEPCAKLLKDFFLKRRKI